MKRGTNMMNKVFSAFNTKDDPVIKHSKKQEKAKKLSTTYEEVVDAVPAEATPAGSSKDYEKIISIQERIIQSKENEFKLLEKLFVHYFDKSVEGWNWYARYWNDYRRLIEIIKYYDNEATVDDLKQTFADMDRDGVGFLETHDVPDWFKKVGAND